MNELIIKIITIALGLAFFIYRSSFIRHYKKFTPRTLIKWVILAILTFFYIYGTFDYALLNFNIYFRIIGGTIVLFLGFLLFFSSHKHLNINWSPIIEKKFTKSRSLVQTGPYKYIRHPIYVASMILLLGFFILTANWLLVGIPVAILIVFYLSKIPREEKELIRNFGKKYEEYKKRTGGFLPKLK